MFRVTLLSSHDQKIRKVRPPPSDKDANRLKPLSLLLGAARKRKEDNAKRRISAEERLGLAEVLRGILPSIEWMHVDLMVYNINAKDYSLYHYLGCITTHSHQEYGKGVSLLCCSLYVNGVLGIFAYAYLIDIHS